MSQPYTPRPYQDIGCEFLMRTPRANFYADPGLGKTVTVLSYIEALQLESVLIVAPWLVIREVWAKEPQKWDEYKHLRIVPIIGTPEERARALLCLPRICAINFELLIWLFRHCGEDWPFRNVIYDESTRLKGFRIRGSTRRSLAVAQYAHLKVERWVNLSGTPNANSYLDLWGSQWFVDGGKALGRTYGAFKERWFYKSANKRGLYGELLPLPGADQEIRDRMRPTTLSIRAKDYFDLQEPIERSIAIELPPMARAQYDSMKRRFYAEIKAGQVTAVNCGVKSLKLRQIASGAVYYDEGLYEVIHEERLAALESILTETAGANLFVVYQFRHELLEVQKRYRFAIDIKAPGAIEDWNAGRIRLLLVHPASAGHGLNLQHGGHHVVYYSPWSDRELYGQVLERIGPVRQLQAGLDRPTYIHHIEALNTVDSLTRRSREGRGSMMELFLEDMRELA